MTNTVRTLVVDDEPLAREGIISLLDRDEDIEVVADCGDGATAIEVIRALNPDLVLLDIEMPGVGGFGVIEAIGPQQMPHTIFVSAYNRFALDAFEISAVDYVVKPFTDERFFRAIARAKHRIRHREIEKVSERLLQLLGQLPASPAPTASVPGGQPGPVGRLPIKSTGRTLFIPANDVIWIQADGAYSRIHARAKTHLVRETLGSVATHLDPNQFLRTHRSAIVNVTEIQELQAFSQGEYILLLSNGARVPLSRRRKAEVERLLGKHS